MSVYNTQEIMEILPHRHPFLLIDTIEELEPGVEDPVGKACRVAQLPVAGPGLEVLRLQLEDHGAAGEHRGAAESHPDRVPQGLLGAYLAAFCLVLAAYFFVIF